MMLLVMVWRVCVCVPCNTAGTDLSARYTEKVPNSRHQLEP